MWAWAGILIGGYLVGLYMTGKPVLSFLILGFVCTVVFLLLTYPVLGWYLFLGGVALVVGSLLLWLIWILLPYIFGFVLGFSLVILLIITIPKVFG